MIAWMVTILNRDGLDLLKVVDRKPMTATGQRDKFCIFATGGTLHITLVRIRRTGQHLSVQRLQHPRQLQKSSTGLQILRI
jgi:hypothetical protein